MGNCVYNLCIDKINGHTAVKPMDQIRGGEYSVNSIFMWDQASF